MWTGTNVSRQGSLRRSAPQSTRVNGQPRCTAWLLSAWRTVATPFISSYVSVNMATRGARPAWLPGQQAAVGQHACHALGVLSLARPVGGRRQVRGDQDLRLQDLAHLVVRPAVAGPVPDALQVVRQHPLPGGLGRGRQSFVTGLAPVGAAAAEFGAGFAQGRRLPGRRAPRPAADGGQCQGAADQLAAGGRTEQLPEHQRALRVLERPARDPPAGRGAAGEQAGAGVSHLGGAGVFPARPSGHECAGPPQGPSRSTTTSVNVVPTSRPLRSSEPPKPRGGWAGTGRPCLAARSGRRSAQLSSRLPDQLVVRAVGVAVAHLPEREQQEQLLEVLGAQPADLERRGVRQAEGQLLLVEVVDQAEDVEAVTLDLLMLCGAQAPDQDVHVQRLGREEGGDLLADDEVRVAGSAAGRPGSCRGR